MTASLFTVRVMARNSNDAHYRVAKRLIPGFKILAEAGYKTPAKDQNIYELCISNDGTGDVDDCWVQLTSYGVFPSSGWSKWNTPRTEAS